MATERILMCPPNFFGVKYVINPWMKRGIVNPPDFKHAYAQWRGLFRTLKEEGVELLMMEAVAEFPDMVFTANAGVAYNNIFIPSRFRPHERRGETPYFKKFFHDLGYAIAELPENVFFEGHGDALFFGKTLVCGHGDLRSDERGVRLAAERIGKEPVLLRLVHERFYHLDTCFCPVGEKILYYPAAFDRASCRTIEKLGETIPVSRGDAWNFVCNAIPIKKKTHWKLLMSHLSSELATTLSRLDIEIRETPLTEFQKAGGSARCLVIFA